MFNDIEPSTVFYQGDQLRLKIQKCLLKTGVYIDKVPIRHKVGNNCMKKTFPELNEKILNSKSWIIYCSSGQAGRIFRNFKSILMTAFLHNINNNAKIIQPCKL